MYQMHLEREFGEAKLANDDATTCKLSSTPRVEKPEDATPNKISGILHLLSNLNGLTPEGMAHLM